METTLSNWRDPGHSTWAFQNVDKLIDVQPIRKGARTLHLKASQRNLDGFKLQLAEKPAMDLASFLSATETDGIVVLKDGDIVYEKYDRTNTAQSKHIMMSMTKSVTGLVCGILVGQGKLDVDALVTKYVPEVQNTPFANVTVRQCLDMRAGNKVSRAHPNLIIMAR
jgi:hypothetical protein